MTWNYIDIDMARRAIKDFLEGPRDLEILKPIEEAGMTLWNTLIEYCRRLEKENKELEARVLALGSLVKYLEKASKTFLELSNAPSYDLPESQGFEERKAYRESKAVLNKVLSTPSPESSKLMAVLEAAKGLHSANKIFEGTPANEVHPALLKVLEPIIDAVEALEGV